ncbi:integrase [Pigmentiphaga litoralis]|uniref:Integrase n=1 Tax=Pigmentiphaga litoralis TaxID=516702 RepID=A0A7Y9IY46_9BURK|nr:integrase [Pigmentiphaga litoralis]NYE85241.1 integrase [Pigmentiphaga litoralis]
MYVWIGRIAVFNGMRLSEVATLRIRQVDIERRVVRLEWTKNFSARTVPLTAEARCVFSEALANPVRPAESEFWFFGEGQGWHPPALPI